MLEARYELARTLYPYARAAAQDRVDHHPVVIVGGGPVGLALALDLGKRGQAVLVLDDHEGPGLGSRAICFAKRTLDIAHRLGAGEAMVEKGVVWNIGKVFRDDRMIYEFDLLPEGGHRMPAFINLQQPYFEGFLYQAIERAQAQGAPIAVRGANRLVDIADGDVQRLEVLTPEGPYTLTADWVVACDGARSPLREMRGLGFKGRVFEDNFLIADVRMKAAFPTERWFWFDPPFRGAGASALLHKQPDDIWRIDFQLGWDIDREAELDPVRIRARVDEMLGEGTDYDLTWTSIYTFQCRRMDSFRDGRVLFAGDSAHQVSPFGARGANSGVQDADNLGWKLAAVLAGQADEQLIDSYCYERELAADENILNSTRSTDFLTPKTDASRMLRDAVLDLAEHHAFARPMVNSGRLSMPSVYDGSPLNAKDALPGGPARTRPGAPCVDAPLDDGYLLDRLGAGFVLLCLNMPVPGGIDLPAFSVVANHIQNAELADRYLGDVDQAIYLIRPDQHVAARWAQASGAEVAQAVARSLGGMQ